MARCGQLRQSGSQVPAGAAGVAPPGNRMPLTALRPVVQSPSPAVSSNVPPYNPPAPGIQHYSISGTFLPNPTLSHSRPPAPNASSALRSDSPPHLVDLSAANTARSPLSGYSSGGIALRPQGPPVAHNNGRVDLSANGLRQVASSNSQQRNSSGQHVSGRSAAPRGAPVARFESHNRYADGSTALQTPIPHPQTLLPSSSGSNNSFR